MKNKYKKLEKRDYHFVEAIDCLHDTSVLARMCRLHSHVITGGSMGVGASPMDVGFLVLFSKNLGKEQSMSRLEHCAQRKIAGMPHHIFVAIPLARQYEGMPYDLGSVRAEALPSLEKILKDQVRGTLIAMGAREIPEMEQFLGNEKVAFEKVAVA